MSDDPMAAALARLHAEHPDLPTDGGRVWEPVQDGEQAPTPLELAEQAVAEAREDAFRQRHLPAIDCLIRAVEARTRAQVAVETATDTTPIPLRWDRLVMHPTGEDDQTIVACMTDDGRPAALFLDDEYREALGLQLVDPDGDICQLHGSDGDPCTADGCGHGAPADCHPRELAS